MVSMVARTPDASTAEAWIDCAQREGGFIYHKKSVYR
jgi:hypothetical protein